MISRIAVTSLMLALSFGVYAASTTIGRTYPVSERDALEEIENRVAGAKPQNFLKQETQQWTALSARSLPKAANNNVRRYTPYYTLEMDIPDATGRVIYPKGFRFNPLEFAKLPNRIVVISEDEAVWAKSQLDKSSIVILTDGDRVKVSKLLDHVVFLLDEHTKDRLSLRAVPSIVVQQGTELVINEYRVER